MIANEGAVGASEPPALKRDWRFYAGVAALLLAVIMPLCAVLVPLLGLPTAAVIDTPASKGRYYFGLTIILVSWLPAYLYAYFPGTMPAGNARIYLLAGMDLAFVASVLLMGGEFWEKVRRIFIYEGES